MPKIPQPTMDEEEFADVDYCEMCGAEVPAGEFFCEACEEETDFDNNLDEDWDYFGEEE